MDPTPALPVLQPEVPEPPALAGFCRLYGKLVDLSGQPVPFRTIEVFLRPTIAVPAIADHVAFVQEPVRAFSDRNGTFFVDVPQDVEITVRMPGLVHGRSMRVPKLEVASLFAYLFSHPVRLYWCASSPGDDTSTFPLAELPPGFIDAAVATDFYIGLAVEYSDGFTCRLNQPKFEAQNASESELIGATIRIKKVTAGTVTITSLEEESLSEPNGLWTRVGYTDPQPPYFVPTEAQSLEDAPLLSVVFA